MDKQAEAFRLSVPEADIADLRKRLEHTRFPDPSIPYHRSDETKLEIEK